MSEREGRSRGVGGWGRTPKMTTQMTKGLGVTKNACKMTKKKILQHDSKMTKYDSKMTKT